MRIEDTLRCLAAEDGRPPAHARDAREEALALVAALITVRASTELYRSAVAAARAAGAGVDDIFYTLRSVAPAVGLARVVSAAPRLALAVGYDLDGALEGRPTEG